MAALAGRLDRNRNHRRRSYRSSTRSGWQRAAPATTMTLLSRWVICLLAIALVGSLSLLPFGWAEKGRAYLSYCFVPGAAEGTRLAAWMDWQPSLARIQAVWSLLTSADDDALSYPCLGTISSPHAWRYHPVTGQLGMHYGIDIKCEAGEPVKAAKNGTVMEVGDDPNLGLFVVLDHGDGLVTKYAHLGEISVEVGARVKRGDLLGQVGQTGITNDVHLHFEVLLHNTPVDPVTKLKPIDR